MTDKEQSRNQSDRNESRERRNRETEQARQRRPERGAVRTNHFWGVQEDQEPRRMAERNDDFAYRRKADAHPGPNERPQRPRRQVRSGETLQDEEHDRARRIARSHARRAADARIEQEEEQKETRARRKPREENPAARPQPIGRIVHPSASQMDVVPDDENVPTRSKRPATRRPRKKPGAPVPERKRRALPESSQDDRADRRPTSPADTGEVNEVEPVILPITPTQESDVVRETIAERTAAQNGPAKAQLPSARKEDERKRAPRPATESWAFTDVREDEDDWAVLLEEEGEPESKPAEEYPAEGYPEIVQGEEEAAPVYHSEPAPPRRRTSLFWVFYAILTVSLIVGAGCIFAYTYSSLVSYEHSQPESIMQGYMEDLKAGGARAEKLKQECFSSDKIGELDNPELLSARFDAGTGKTSYRFEEGGVAFDTSAPIYTVYADEQPFITLHFAPVKSHVSLGLLNITDWGISSALLHDAAVPAEDAANVDTGLNSAIAVPNNAVVTFNGQTLGPQHLADEETVLPGFEYAANFVEVPKSVSYQLEGLRTSPEVSVTNFEGAPIEMRQSGLNYTATSFATPNRTPEQLPVDPLEIGKTWSKFMTADLGGASYGVDQVTSFLIPGSELYNLATTFANSIDITFVSTHVIDGWSEERVTNCVMYNERLFSCDVHFVKNMTLNTGVTRADEFNNTMIFAYVDDENVYMPGWYLVNMQAITA